MRAAAGAVDRQQTVTHACYLAPMMTDRQHTRADALRASGIAKSFGDTRVLHNIELTLAPGEVVSLLGPSGCGKTTLLRIAAGLLAASSGEMHIGGEPVVDGSRFNAAPEARGIGMVFQDYALFPHLTVGKNIAFGMRMKKCYTKAQIRDRVEELLALVGLEGYEHRYPDRLSGGEQQRIALLRALAPHPAVLLLDEPLSALDFQLRKRLRQEIQKVQRQLGITTIFVTHDQEEALSISDRITVMNNGQIEQIGAPADIYQNPKTEYVAQFVGMSNVLSGIVLHQEQGCFVVQTLHQRMVIPARQDYLVHDPITFFFRPEESYLSRTPQEKNTIQGVIVGQEYLGAEILTTIRSQDGQEYLVSNYIKDEHFIQQAGQPVYLNVPVNACKTVGSAVRTLSPAGQG